MARVKLPDFWPEAAHVWFCRADAEFQTKNVTLSSTKHSYLVAALPQDVALRVADALLQPDATDPYISLRDRLLKVYTLNDYERAEKLLDMPPMVGERPTVIMDRMLSLLPDSASRDDPGFLFRTIFLRKLPGDIRTQLVTLKTESIRELAEQGDEFWSTRPTTSTVSTVSQDANLLDQESVDVMPVRQLCFYHSKFGVKAEKCRKPCSWKPGNDRAGRGQ